MHQQTQDRTRRRNGTCDYNTPIPYPISLELTFLDEEELTKEQYQREVRKVIRKHLVPLNPSLYEEGPFREYDPELWKVIREVMEEV